MAPKLFLAMKSPMKVMKAPKAKAKAKADAKAKAKAKAKVKAEPPTTPAKSLLKFRSMTNKFSIPFWPGLMTQRLDPSGPFTKEWPGMIQGRKSLLPPGS